MPAEDLLGLHYEAPFTIVEDPDEDYRYVVDADYVTASDGSGLVHTAPAFGADDMETGRRHGLPVVNPVDAQGRFTAGPWKGQFVKDADPAITERLEADGTLLLAAGVRAHLPVLLALQDAADLLGQAVLVHPHDREAPGAAGQQRQHPVVPRAHPRRAVRQLAREQRRLGPVAGPVLGHARCPSGAAATATT